MRAENFCLKFEKLWGRCYRTGAAVSLIDRNRPALAVPLHGLTGGRLIRFAACCENLPRSLTKRMVETGSGFKDPFM